MEMDQRVVGHSSWQSHLSKMIVRMVGNRMQQRMDNPVEQPMAVVCVYLHEMIWIETLRMQKNEMISSSIHCGGMREHTQQSFPHTCANVRRSNGEQLCYMNEVNVQSNISIELSD